MTLPVVFTANGPTGYNLTNSLRFRSSASAWLNRTPASSSNLNTWTISWWTKRGQLSTPAQTTMFGTDYAASQEFMLQFTANNRFVFEQYAAGGVVVLGSLITTQVFRDPSAWYHFVVTWDSTQATAANRIKIYVNGVQITAFDTAVYPSQNASSVWNQATNQHRIGQYSTAKYYDGYMGETHFIDGQALTPSSFGSFNALTGVWQPARYTGTYGTNGFYLPFTDNSALTTSSNVGLGKDFSGNGNYWTTNNISITAGTTYDSMTDVPTLTSATTANYCTLNAALQAGGYTLNDGNLNWARTGSSGGANDRSQFGTIGVTSGKWYWEFTAGTVNSNSIPAFGIAIGSASTQSWAGSQTGAYIYNSDGTKNISGTSSSYGASFATGDIIGVAFDADAGTLTFYKNNTSQGQAASGLTSGPYFPAVTRSVGGGGSNGTEIANFGQRPFVYTPPTGFVALNTFNLPNSTIVAGNKQMDVSLYTGNNATPRSITGLNFQPDWVWIKDRSNAYNHTLWDSVRGVGSNKGLSSNSTDPEGLGVALGSTAANGYVSALNTTGFEVTSGSSTNVYVNTSPDAYVAWNWKAGGTAVTNTAGTISAQVSANTTSGFSVVTWTGNNVSSATVGHGLGVKPAMVIAKCRSASNDWWVTHQGIPNSYIYLQSTGAAATGGGSNGAMNYQSTYTSSVFGFLAGSSSVNNVNANGSTYVAYCFAQIAGYSAFGSYTGNGSADGPFVFTGFEPRFVMVKASSFAGESWYMFDSARSTYNVVGDFLLANQSLQDIYFASLDFLSNGFKLRTTNSLGNTNGATYIYMAFAENPFKNALAR